MNRRNSGDEPDSNDPGGKRKGKMPPVRHPLDKKDRRGSTAQARARARRSYSPFGRHATKRFPK